MSGKSEILLEPVLCGDCRFFTRILPPGSAWEDGRKVSILYRLVSRRAFCLRDTGLKTVHRNPVTGKMTYDRDEGWFFADTRNSRLDCASFENRD